MLAKIFSVFLIILSLVVHSCSPLKHVPEDMALLTEMSIKCNDKEISSSELDSYKRQKPNRRFLGISIYLRLHSFFVPKISYIEKGKEKPNFFERMGKIIGDEPIIYDPFKANKTKKQLELYLKNKGYYQAEVIMNEVIERRRAKINYTITSNKASIIRNNYLQTADIKIDSLLSTDTSLFEVKKGKKFDIKFLEKDRAAITRFLKNSGYYSFSQDFVRFNADTSFSTPQNPQVDVWTVILRNSQIDEYSGKTTTDSINHKTFTVNNVYIYTDYNPKKALQNSTKYRNTLKESQFESFTFLTDSILSIKPVAAIEHIFIQPDSLYRLRDVEKTYSELSSLQLFKVINISFTDVENSSKSNDYNYIDCHIKLTPQTSQSFQFEIEGTNASGNLGAAGSYYYKHKNLFKGAEAFTIKLKGAIEAQNRIAKTEESEPNDKYIMNTYEYGIETNIDIPKFLFDLRSIDRTRLYNPKTQISLSYSYQNRPDYNRTIANMAYGYQWNSKGSSRFLHSINPVEINLIKVTNQTQAFQDYIENLYQKSSYSNQFITETNYSFVYNNQDISKKYQNHIFLKLYIESSGNIMAMWNSVLEKTKIEHTYQIFGLAFAQYVKSDFDFRYYYKLHSMFVKQTKPNCLVFRLFAGAALPYGNSRSGLPFIKKYYSGGANSIRAWMVRDVGPGTYNDTITSFPNQTADLKLETNLEYRFPMFWLIEGAAFIDIGNIWALTNRDERPGALFQIENFYKELAVGTGLGLRFDFDFFIIRFDFGLKLHDPHNKQWIIGNRKLTNADWTFNVGIGYPF